MSNWSKVTLLEVGSAQIQLLTCMYRPYPLSRSLLHILEVSSRKRYTHMFILLYVPSFLKASPPVCRQETPCKLSCCYEKASEGPLGLLALLSLIPSRQKTHWTGRFWEPEDKKYPQETFYFPWRPLLFHTVLTSLTFCRSARGSLASVRKRDLVWKVHACFLDSGTSRSCHMVQQEPRKTGFMSDSRMTEHVKL